MALGRLTFLIFIVFQVSDGLITYGAVSIFGPGAEGNPLIAAWMHIAGPAPALIGAKVVACGCGAVLYVFGIQRMLAALTGLYLLGALLPWLHILSA